VAVAISSSWLAGDQEFRRRFSLGSWWFVAVALSSSWLAGDQEFRRRFFWAVGFAAVAISSSWLAGDQEFRRRFLWRRGGSRRSRLTKNRVSLRIDAAHQLTTISGRRAVRTAIRPSPIESSWRLG
jgi:hypothetical protein